MAYTVAPTQPVSGSTLVHLDTGAYVLLALHSRVLPNIASLRIDGTAIVCDATGAPVLDANGRQTATGYGITLTPQDSQDASAVKSWMGDVARALLGEPLVNASIQTDQNVAQASVRNAIAAAAHAGPVTDLQSIL